MKHIKPHPSSPLLPSPPFSFSFLFIAQMGMDSKVSRMLDESAITEPCPCPSYRQDNPEPQFCLGLLIKAGKVLSGTSVSPSTLWSTAEPTIQGYRENRVETFLYTSIPTPDQRCWSGPLVTAVCLTPTLVCLAYTQEEFVPHMIPCLSLPKLRRVSIIQANWTPCQGPGTRHLLLLDILLS